VKAPPSVGALPGPVAQRPRGVCVNDSPAPHNPPLSEQLAELGAITGGLAHEIRNPLSTIKVNLQLLSEDLRDAQRHLDPGHPHEHLFRRSLLRLETLRQQVTRMGAILDSFLSYVGGTEPQTARVDLNDMVDRLVEFFSPQARSAGLTLRVALADGPLWCDIDEDLLQQAVLNLLVNAQQAVGDSGEIIVRTVRAAGGEAHVVVQDTGPGIDPQHRERIWQAFYSTKQGGTGLGLPLARRIVRMHGGDIDIDSQPGHGASFVIRLPRTATGSP